MKKTITKKAQSISQTHSFAATFKLFNIYWWKSFFGPFFAFGFSFLIYAILGSIMGYKTMFSGIVAMCAMAQGITGMPFSILELKNSVLLKRIGASPVKTWVFTLVIVTYFMAVSVLVWMYLTIWGLVFTQDLHMFDDLFATAQSFFTFFYGFILNAAMSISIGFAISSIARGSNQAQAIGMIIYFPSSFLSGQFLSPAIIAQNDAMNWISRFLPFRYTTMYMQEGWGNANAFAFTQDFLIPQPPDLTTSEWIKIAQDLNGGDQGTQEILNLLAQKTNKIWVVIYDKYDHIVGSFYPLLTIIATIIFSIRKFKWSSMR